MEITKLDWGIKCLRICDLNGDGKNDMVIANNAKSKIEILIQKDSISTDQSAVTVNPEDADINALFDSTATRFKKDDIVVTQTIYSLVCGDLNSDGKIDIAYYGEPRGLYVLLQNTEPNASKDKNKVLSWQQRKKINIEDGLITPDSLICADLNNDKRADLALAANDGVYIIEQKDDGTLAEPVKYPCTERIIGIDCADLDGDKIKDLIIITTDSEKPLYVRFGLPNGQLGPIRQFFIERPWICLPYDIDGNGHDEILTIDAKSGRLSCYKFVSSEGKKNSDWPITFYPLAGGESDTKRDLVSGDFDGDGLTDVAISDPGAAELILYKQTPNTGLVEPVKFPALADITSLSAADIDGDKKSELAVLSVKEKIIGIAKFEDNRLSFPKPLETTGEPLAMELDDIDSDGRMDCVYISSSAEPDSKRFLRIIYNVGANQKNAAEIDNIEPALEIAKLKSNPDGLKVVDVDGDGLKDLLIFVKYESPILIRQMQKRKFAVIDSPVSQSSLIKDATVSSIAVAGGKAGSELLIAQKNFARSLLFENGQNWRVCDQYNAKSTENRISAVGVFDIADGNNAAERSILLLDGQKGQLQILQAGKDKTYRLEKEINVGRWESADHLKMLYESIGEKGAKNILLFDSKKFALISPDSRTNAARAIEQMFSYETKIKDGVYGNLAVGDINSDGITDFVMVDYKNNNIEILTLGNLKNPVVGTRFKLFEEKTSAEKTGKTAVEPHQIEVTDVTGDGKPDVVTVIHDRIIIYPQD
jgi:hypothetical protein